MSGALAAWDRFLARSGNTLSLGLFRILFALCLPALLLFRIADQKLVPGFKSLYKCDPGQIFLEALIELCAIRDSITLQLLSTLHGYIGCEKGFP